jgi:hypothetical protein
VRPRRRRRLAATLLAAAVLGACRSPVRGLVRYRVTVEAHDVVGDTVRVESGEGREEEWDAFHDAVKRGCRGHLVGNVDLDGGTLSVRPPRPLASLFAGEVEVHLSPRVGTNPRVGTGRAGRGPSMRLGPRWYGWTPMGPFLHLTVRGPAAADVRAHLPVELTVVVRLIGHCLDPDDVHPGGGDDHGIHVPP